MHGSGISITVDRDMPFEVTNTAESEEKQCAAFIFSNRSKNERRQAKAEVSVNEVFNDGELRNIEFRSDWSKVRQSFHPISIDHSDRDRNKSR